MPWTREKKHFVSLLIWRQKSFKTVSKLTQHMIMIMIYYCDKKLKKKIACPGG